MVRKSKNSSNKKAVAKYRKTFKGWINASFYMMFVNASAKKRDAPNFTKEQYIDFIKSNENFEAIFDRWEKSGFNKWEKPSADRIDPLKSYTLDNIRIVSWKQNYAGSAIGMQATGRWKISKLTKENVINIKMRLQAGEKGRSIAKEFNVHENVVSTIKLGRTFKDV